MSDLNKMKIKKLVKSINHHRYLYYVESSPTISDYEYDMLIKELEELEEDYPQYKHKNSPTETIGSDLRRDYERPS